MYTMPLERGKIREFARATQSENPAYDGPDAITPPTFLTTASLTWEPPGEIDFGDLAFDMRRVLHAEEEYIFHGPPPAVGQSLSVRGRLGEIYEKAGKRGGQLTFVTFVHEYYDEAGALVAEQHTTLVQTSHAPEGGSTT